MNADRWELAINEEECMWKRACHVVSNIEGQRRIIEYWSNVLDMMPFKIKPDNRILDIGCGPAGILQAIKHGIKRGIDPLMEEYQSNFSLPSDCQWISSKIEDYQDDEKFDIIFVWNSLDHVDDLHKAVQSIKRLLSKDGYLVISVWCHTTRIFEYYFKAFNRYIDKFHPHQLSKKDILDLFAEYSLIKHSFIPKDGGWDESQVVPIRTFSADVLHLVRHPLKTLVLPIKLLDFTRLFPSRSPEGRSIYKFNLFVFHASQ